MKTRVDTKGLPSWWLAKVKKCFRCGLSEWRRQVVVGRGSVPADMLFLGEAPGKSEDLLGEPFRGPAGKLLDKLIFDATTLRREDNPGFVLPSYYVTNTILCRPTSKYNGDNRQPTKEEECACHEWIQFIGGQVKPKVLILIGKVAKKYYGHSTLGTMRAEIQHPSFILRTGGLKSPWYLRNVRELADIFTYMEKLGD